MPEIVPNSLKYSQSSCKWIYNCVWDYWWRFGENSHGSEFGWFWPKNLGYCPWFWRWRILALHGNRPKLTKTSWTGVKIIVCEDFDWITKGPNLNDFDQKAWAIAHGFEDGRFWWALEIIPNSLKHMPQVWKSFLTTTCGIFVQISTEFPRVQIWPILTKNPGRRWQILVSSGNRPKLPKISCTDMKIIFNWLQDWTRKPGL